MVEQIDLGFHKSDWNTVHQDCRYSRNQIGRIRARMGFDCVTKLLQGLVMVEKNPIIAQQKNVKMVNDEIMDESYLSIALQ